MFPLLRMIAPCHLALGVHRNLSQSVYRRHHLLCDLLDSYVHFRRHGHDEMSDHLDAYLTTGSGNSVDLGEYPNSRGRDRGTLSCSWKRQLLRPLVLLGQEEIDPMHAFEQAVWD